MIALLAYGSLMHRQELSTQLGREHPCVPVRVRGFRRSFCQEPAWRRGTAAAQGVLTVRPSAAAWLNGVLVCEQDPSSLASLDHRERGYVRRPVPSELIEPYGSNPLLDAIERIHIYAGREDLLNDGLLPNPDYRDLCLEAARSWGAHFLGDFLSSTYVGQRLLADLELASDPE